MATTELNTTLPISLYEKLEVWSRISEGVATRFIVLRRLSDGLFAVQNADILCLPLKRTPALEVEDMFLDLFLDEDPSERCACYLSIENAVREHNNAFGIGA